jgi:hypothetical protein
MLRLILCIISCAAALPAYANEFEKTQSTIFEGDGNTVKSEYRSCKQNSECTSALSMCRWRPVNKASARNIETLSKKLTLECKWPGIAPQPEAVNCINNLCEIPSDGKFY